MFDFEDEDNMEAKEDKKLDRKHKKWMIKDLQVNILLKVLLIATALLNLPELLQKVGL